MMSLADSFREEVEAFLTETEMKPTQFGRAAIRDPGFVFGLRNGRSPTIKIVDQVRSWMAKQRKERQPAA